MDYSNMKVFSISTILSSLFFASLFFISITLFSRPTFLYCYSYSSRKIPEIKSVIEHQQEQKQPEKVILPQETFRRGENNQVTEKTWLKHIVFGIASSVDTWNHRKNYIKLWFKKDKMRGVVWLDKPLDNTTDSDQFPEIRVSADTSRFKYTNPNGSRSAIRITRVVSETLRLGMEDVRWFVMGDDDTMFVPENLVMVLNKFDHNEFYYIGSNSESHIQNIKSFSCNMAYGGGGFAISYPLAVALAKIQDQCIQRYPSLYGSDDRIHACMTELGVPLTKHTGFHQFDIYGDALGILTAHPITPLVSLHHLDVIRPIFPNTNQIEALQRFTIPMELDSASLMQQSICYDHTRRWTISVSWGYVVQVIRGEIPPRKMEVPPMTFVNWYTKPDGTNPFTFSFNTRPNGQHCEHPFVFFLSNATYDHNINQTISQYVRPKARNPRCRMKIPDPSSIYQVEVYKRPKSTLWDKSPRRNCCRILATKKKGTLEVEVEVCKDNEIIET